MGEVYEAERLSTHDVFAVKLIRPEFAAAADYAARFAREVGALRAIRHPNVVNVFEWSLPAPGSGNAAFVVMELLDGEPLDEVLRREGSIPPCRAVRIMLQVLEGLAAAHEKGVLHRDLGPSNIFLERTTKGASRVKLLDFGLARPVAGTHPDQGLTQAGMVMGKAAYAPPELFHSAPLDERADVYACGIVMFRMLTGRFPYKATDTQMLWLERWADREQTEEYPSPRRQVPNIPLDLDGAVARAIRKRPDDRYRSAREMQEALVRVESRLLDDGPTTMAAPAGRGGPQPAAGAPSAEGRARGGTAGSGAAAKRGEAEAAGSTVAARTTGFRLEHPRRRRAAQIAAAAAAAAVAVVLAARLLQQPEAPVDAGTGARRVIENIAIPSPPAVPQAVLSVREPATPLLLPGPDASDHPAAAVPPAGDGGEVPLVREGVDAGETLGAADVGSRTVHITLENVPRGAQVTVAGKQILAMDGVDLAWSTEPVDVSIRPAGGRYEPYVTQVVPDQDRTIRPRWRRARDIEGVPAPGPVSSPRAEDAGSPTKIGGAMGTTFSTDWGNDP
jgi:hypothetical protein